MRELVNMKDLFEDMVELGDGESRIAVGAGVEYESKKGGCFSLQLVVYLSNEEMRKEGWNLKLKDEMVQAYLTGMERIRKEIEHHWDAAHEDKPEKPKPEPEPEAKP